MIAKSVIFSFLFATSIWPGAVPADGGQAVQVAPSLSFVSN